jgi:methyl-accepting chemotaxis protein
MNVLKALANLKIKVKIGLGFTALCLILAIVVGYTYREVADIADRTHQTVNLRVPVALTSGELVGDLYSTLATLRGYLLTGDPAMKKGREAMWSQFDDDIARFDTLAAQFTDPENKRIWSEAKAVIAQFREAQDKAEAIAFTPDAFPATKLLTTEAAPRANIMATAITKMIDEEEGLPVTAERKVLFKAMADTRGNLGLALANVRAFLLSGDAQFKEMFQARWTAVEQAVARVSGSRSLLSASQRAAFEEFTKALQEFAPLPGRMFEIRDSNGWNVPVQILATEAAPRAAKLLDLLEGERDATGKRSGGLKDRQTELLNKDAQATVAGIELLETILLTLLVVGLAVGIGVAFVTASSIVNPVRSMTDAMKRLAGGDSATVVPARERQDEIGDMAKSVQVFKDNMIETERLRAEQAAAETRAVEERKALMNKMADDFEAAVGGIVGMVSSASTELKSAAESMASTAEETSRQSTAVAAATEQASANVQTVAAATEELSSSIGEISRQVGTSSKIASKAVEDADATNAKVQALAEAANKIGDVVKLINDIAGQTNLLALNATIEAARAGDAGKGFAVVASEVKSLANQTAKATEEIAGQINAIQGATAESVHAIEGITKTIREVNEIATTIASAVEEQGSATQEIARNVQQASAGTAEVSSNITGVTQAAGETGSAASQVLASAGELSTQSEKLKAEVDRFLAEVRAA